MGSLWPGYSGTAGRNLRMRFTATEKLNRGLPSLSIAHLHLVANDNTRRQQRAQRKQVPRNGVAEAMVVDMDAGESGHGPFRSTGVCR